jgi:hypothetical protein
MSQKIYELRGKVGEFEDGNLWQLKALMGFCELESFLMLSSEVWIED